MTKCELLNMNRVYNHWLYYFSTVCVGINKAYICVCTSNHFRFSTSFVSPIIECIMSICVCKYIYPFVHQKKIKLKNALWLQEHYETTFSIFSFICFDLWPRTYRHITFVKLGGGGKNGNVLQWRMRGAAYFQLVALSIVIMTFTFGKMK